MALAAFIRRSQREVWRLCAYLVDRQAADDLTQEVYLRAWTALPGWRAEASARTWLLAIARRTCAHAIRRRGWPLIPPVETAPDDHQILPDPAETVMLTQVITGLDPQRRAAFVLTQLLGLSYAETAEVCGCRSAPSAPGSRGPAPTSPTSYATAAWRQQSRTPRMSDQAR